LSVVAAAYGCFAYDGSLNWIAVTPQPWSQFDQMIGQLQADATRYLAQFAAMLVMFGAAMHAMGHRPIHFLLSFTLLYVMSLAVLIVAASDMMLDYSLEAPVIALLIGLAISNLIGLPTRLDAGFRVEFYIKTGIVLLGATLPASVIVWAGPIAILQASIVSLITFGVIFRFARFMELDRRLAALLAAGGAICGVSAVLAVGGAVRARRDEMTIAITIVVFWSIGMIVVLPLLARAWYLSAGAGGAWIGTSEFADAAGFAAAQTYGAIARSGSVTGGPDQAIWAFTLVKVVGRDLWIGIWAFVMSLISVTRWETREVGARVDPSQIWWRFPKFILGFIIASLLITLATRDLAFADYNDHARPSLIVPLTTFRGWVFTFSFLSIGLSTRLKGFQAVSGNAFLAFSAGVVVNVVVGFILSAVVFEAYWSNLRL
jgi:uncharacterized membrane protein YadS